MFFPPLKWTFDVLDINLILVEIKSFLFTSSLLQSIATLDLANGCKW
jgi:hypothetical protein